MGFTFFKQDVSVSLSRRASGPRVSKVTESGSSVFCCQDLAPPELSAQTNQHTEY